MKNKALLLVLIFSVFFVTLSHSQDSDADKLYWKAISKMDNEGDYSGAIKLLDEAIKLEPKNIDFQYEKAYAYFKWEDYKSAAKILEKLVKSADATPLCFQLLGNTYNHLGEKGKSDEIYMKGIEKFPDAGVLYTGQGLKALNEKEYDKALEWFEKGMVMDPGYRSDYYYASLLFAGSTETVWSVLYGEIFCNLEPKGNRFDLMSKVLYGVYDTCIVFKDSSIEVNFTKNATISMDDLKDLKLPFANTVFEMNYLLSLIGEEEMSIATLNRVRAKFIELYISKKQNVEFPNVLFDYQKKLIDLDYFESYNYWLFYNGNQAEADKWISQNKEKYDQFKEWFAKNPLELSKEKMFYRLQY
jgi:tetratricopeptide (TPR) repeat protein